MIRPFMVEHERLRQVGDFAKHRDRIVWADLVAPSRDEELLVEGWLGIGVPSREEMEEIEISSRLYTENGAYFMTATLPASTDDDHPVMEPVTFVLADQRLVTIRYHEPRAFVTFPQRAEKVATGCTLGDTILAGLLEAIVDRLADVLERVGREVESISNNIFHASEPKASKRDRDFHHLLKEIGRKEGLVAHIRNSLMTLQRLSGFLANATSTQNVEEMRARVTTLSRDVTSLSNHGDFLSQKITFLLDATLGMISIEQNAIIKIFSVAAVVFLPPTLVASIYGMNFKLMPELEWPFGYPLAIGLMILSAVGPFWLFRRRGWL